jgi:hypothetical protein
MTETGRAHPADGVDRSRKTDGELRRQGWLPSWIVSFSPHAIR